MICYADLDTAAKCKLSSNFTTIQNRRRLRSAAIIETNGETKSL